VVLQPSTTGLAQPRPWFPTTLASFFSPLLPRRDHFIYLIYPSQFLFLLILSIVSLASIMSPIKVTRPAPQTTRTLRSHTKTKPPPPARQLRRRARADPWTPRRKVTKAPKPRAPPPTHYTCRICAEEQPISSFIKWFPRSRDLRRMKADIPYACVRHLCRSPRHKNDPVCRTCIGASMAAKLDLTGARTLGNGCLEPGCGTSWGWT